MLSAAVLPAASDDMEHSSLISSKPVALDHLPNYSNIVISITLRNGYTIRTLVKSVTVIFHMV